MNNPFKKRKSFGHEEEFPILPVPKNRYGIHILLFILTLLSTTLAGAELITGKTMGELSFADDFYKGLPYSLTFLAFLTFHEFGHYFTAMYHGVRSSLPYYIPLYLPFSIFNIGSMGAVIRMREVPSSTKKYFDIGIAGPLAGFVVSVILLAYGFAYLPDPAYLHSIHPEYLDWFGNRMPSDTELQEALRSTGAMSIELGSSLIFVFFQYVFADPERLPGPMELYHYPYVFVGYLTLFFTALNLLPIGQLDGGHVTYGLFGRKTAGLISRITVLFLVTYGGLGLINYAENFSMITLVLYLLYLRYVLRKIIGKEREIEVLSGVLSIVALQYLLQTYTQLQMGGTLWLFYSFIAVRVIRIDHPPAYVEEPLDLKRKILGLLALFIFIICFTPDPIKLVVLEPPMPGDKPLEEEKKNEILVNGDYISYENRKLSYGINSGERYKPGLNAIFHLSGNDTYSLLPEFEINN